MSQRQYLISGDDDMHVSAGYMPVTQTGYVAATIHETSDDYRSLEAVDAGGQSVNSAHMFSQAQPDQKMSYTDLLMAPPDQGMYDFYTSSSECSVFRPNANDAMAITASTETGPSLTRAAARTRCFRTWARWKDQFKQEQKQGKRCKSAEYEINGLKLKMKSNGQVVLCSAQFIAEQHAADQNTSLVTLQSYSWGLDESGEWLQLCKAIKTAEHDWYGKNASMKGKTASKKVKVGELLPESWRA